MKYNNHRSATYINEISELTAIANRTKQAIRSAVDRELRRMDSELDQYISDRVKRIEREIDQPKQKTKLKFGSLFEYFKTNTEQQLTLTFDELGEIIGEPLCASAHKYREYWTRYGRSRLADCWYANGYKIKKLDLANKMVSFYQVNINDSVTDALEELTSPLDE